MITTVRCHAPDLLSSCEPANDFFLVSCVRYFRIPEAPARCSDAHYCMANVACYGSLLGKQMRGYINESEAVKAATKCAPEVTRRASCVCVLYLAVTEYLLS